MRKGVAVLSVALTVAGMGISAAACEDTAPNTFPEGEPDATFDSGPGFNTDGNTTGKDAFGPVDCNPALPATFKVDWKAPKQKPVPAACSAEDLTGYYDACLKPSFDEKECKTWREAHATCTTCIEPEDNPGPIQQHLERYYYTLNVAGCLALERKEPEVGKCPAVFSDSIQCQRASCNNCLPTQGATFPDFQKCQKEAKTSACAGYESKIVQVCTTTYNDPDGGAYGCFQNGPEGQKAHFVRVEGIFCGP